MKIIRGRFKGQEIKIDKKVKIDPCLPLLVSKGNWAAKNAIEIDGYTIADAPFVYGKIGSLGYILSAADIKN